VLRDKAPGPAGPPPSQSQVGCNAIWAMGHGPARQHGHEVHGAHLMNILQRGLKGSRHSFVRQMALSAKPSIRRYRREK